MSSSPERVLITRSPHVTLTYLLMTDLHEIKNTAYFFVITSAYSEEEIKHTREFFPQSYFIREHRRKLYFRNYPILRRFCSALQLFIKVTVPYLVLRATKNFRWPFLKTAEIFCWDSGTTQALIGKRDCTVFEEGIGTYQEFIPLQARSYLSRFITFLYAPFAAVKLELEPQAKRLIFTDISAQCDIPICYKGKNIEFVSMPGLWANSSPEKKAFIMKFFDLTFEDVKAIKQKDIIFVEQPFSTYITVEEKIEMMRRIFARYDHSRILLKNHYRTTINYREFFPDILVWDKHTPMELLNLCGAKFTEVITVNSTAALCFSEDVRIVWLGSNPDDPCFAHFSAKSRKNFNEFLSNIPIPKRIKAQDEKKEGLF